MRHNGSSHWQWLNIGAVDVLCMTMTMCMNCEIETEMLREISSKSHQRGKSPPFTHRNKLWEMSSGSYDRIS
jgi:hypothetical protein